MEQEVFFSGYCRSMDQSRTVTVVTVDALVEEMDCAYDRCIHHMAVGAHAAQLCFQFQ